MMNGEMIFAGSGGYARLTGVEYEDRRGALLMISNPHSRLNTVPPEALAEMAGAVDALDAAGGCEFLVLDGAEGGVHAGADLTMFAGGLSAAEGAPDYEATHAYSKAARLWICG